MKCFFQRTKMKLYLTSYSRDMEQSEKDGGLDSG